MSVQLGHISSTNENDPYHGVASLFAKKVHEKTNGTVTIEVLPSSQLGGERDMLEGLQIGTLDLAVIGNTTMTIINNESFFTELPFIFATEEHAYRYIDSDINTGISDRLYKNQGIKILAWGEVGFRNFLTSNAPIHTPDDIKNRKFRVMESAMMIDGYKMLGANPTPIAFAELFTSLQQGIVDGCDFPIVTAYTSRLYEVTKYFALTKAFYNTITVSSSKKFFDSLSPELQHIFSKAGAETTVEQRTFNRSIEEKILGLLEQEGMIIDRNVDNAAFRNLMQPIYNEYRPKIGEEIFDSAMKLLDED
jgi:tripartite ATP-independent transporter DctP family solute receptor